ncbi:MAG TPA: S8 family serine peptidase [Verrucomicrobiae bacterium]|nr:S8 family serine peptidase [Verrucomicrobiae bacterium]
MRLRPLFWLLISAVCFIGAFYFWRLGNQWREQKHAAVNPAPAQSAKPATPAATTTYSSTAPVGLFLKDQSTNAVAATNETNLATRYRLSNTTKTVGQLAQDDHAILLANALIDLRMPLDLHIPDSLKSEGDPGAYIVQSQGAINDLFRARLKGAGVAVVSYIPNNAYLVTATESTARQLRGLPGVQAVIPFEPYFKLDPRLLGWVLNGDQPPESSSFNVVVFPNEVEKTLKAWEDQGVTVVPRGSTPFGQQFMISGISDVASVAKLPGVGTIELFTPRRPANDLARARVAVSSNSTNAENYLGLTGSNVLVNINDTGVSGSHPDLTGRVFGPASTSDPDGHGTHVAGIIAGDGTESLTVSNAPGSSMPPVDKQFRGMAPGSHLFAMPFADIFSDLDLQEAAARTNALISNNSWGYSDTAYDIASASYDAAVRDSLSTETGSQPVMYVFAAGNEGGGNEAGLGGRSQSVLSPGTAKNVITVGALEQFRNLTNEVTVHNGSPTPYWQLGTDSSDEVASFSSRGNVGIGVEGDFGRFKPDVVAPGVFVVSARWLDWDEAAYYNPTSTVTHTDLDQIVQTNSMKRSSIFIPDNAVQVIIQVGDTIPHVDEMPIYVRENGFPTAGDFVDFNQVEIPPDKPLNPGVELFYAVGNPTNVPVRYDVTTILVLTNEMGNYFEVLSNMNNQLGPNYRYESGTSMAAPVVSGTLALISDFFTNKLGTLPSPALMKAMLINGARSANEIYDLNVTKNGGDNRNYQGWGVVNLTNSLAGLSTNSTPTKEMFAQGPSSVLFFDQDATNALGTADRRTFTVTLDPKAVNLPLRATLVWTDPPGNPVAGIKLVNDLDLIVTNLTDKSVYYGNDIQPDSNFSSAWNTNGTPNRDFINNVENVFIAPTPFSTNNQQFSITVLGRNVNVNAVPGHTNKVAQDFALVISSGNGQVTNALTLASFPPTTTASTAYTNITYMTNQFAGTGVTNLSGGLLLNQHVGANSPLIGNGTAQVGGDTIWGSGGTNGMIFLGSTNQWHFYALTNEFSYTNAAFVTFLAPTLALPRMGVTNYDNQDEASRVEADIDLYVSQDPKLLQLAPEVIESSMKAVGRYGTEVVATTNAQPGVYYVAVHSEDRQAAEYGFFGGFSLLPFSDDDGRGVTLRGINVPLEIPDGNPAQPGVARVLAICVSPIQVRRVVVTNLTIFHENLGDLVGNLSHGQNFAVLHNHRPGNGLVEMQFEDNEENDPDTAQRTDGPGSLRNFVGERGEGLWLLTEIDDASGHTGRVENLTIRLDRQLPLEDGIDATIQPHSFRVFYVDAVPETTNITIWVTNISTSPLPLELYVRHGDFPSLTQFDYRSDIPLPPDGLVFTIDQSSSPPLRTGRYFIGIYNPNDEPQTVHLIVKHFEDTRGVPTIDFTMFGPQPIPDDAVSYSTIHVPYDRTIARVDVGVAIQHPRISDLALTLISPKGKRILLSENRGGTSADMGNILVTTNLTGVSSAGGQLASTNVIAITNSSGILVVDFDFHEAPDTMDVYYGETNIFSSGPLTGHGTLTIPFGPGSETNLTIIINQNGNPYDTTVWDYTARVITETGSYFTFSENTNFTQIPIKFVVPPFGSGANGWSEWSSSVGGNDHWYKAVVNQSGLNWLQANAIAASQGAYLATILSAAENQFVFGLINNPQFFAGHGGNGSGPAIGGVQLSGSSEPGQGWSWETGEIFSYANWNVGKPDNGGGNEDRIHYFSGTQGVPSDRWNDIRGIDTNLGGYVMERGPVSKVFYFPEESLQDLVAENSLGDWRLEIWDNRAGAVVPVPQLLTWQLRFIFDKEIFPTTVLQHDVTVTNTIAPCQSVYFSVDVPSWASYITNTLVSASAPVNVFVTTNNPAATDGTLVDGVALFDPMPTMGDFAVLNTNFVSTGRYYIQVENPCDNTTNATFAFKIEFNTTALSNAIPVTSTNLGDAVPRYFHFDVSTNATAVSFQLTNMSGNFDLVARYGGPLPTTASFDYGSFSPGTQDEEIIVFPDSNPVPLAPGRWYLGVFNTSLLSNVFTIVATEYTNDFKLITLTNTIPYTNSTPANGEDHYRFVVSGAAVRAQFEINNPSGDMILVASKGLPLPNQAVYDYLSDNPFLNDEMIVVFTNSTPVALTPGDWFLTAINVSGAPVDYSIKATEWFSTGRPITVTDVDYTPPDGTNSAGFCITWSSLPGIHYYIEGNPDLTTTNWTVVSPTITATDFTTTYCVPIGPGNMFFRVVEGLAISDFAPPQNFSVIPAAGGFLLQWRGSADSQYQLQWATNLPPAWNAFTPTNMTSTNVPFTNGVYSFLDDSTQLGGPPPPLQTFYRVLLLP